MGTDRRGDRRARRLARLQATGIYGNPNDLSRILVVGILLGLYFLGDRRLGLLRPLWLLPIGLFGLGLHLTHSRGGLMSLLGGLGGLSIIASAEKRRSSSLLSCCRSFWSPSGADKPTSRQVGERVSRG